MSQLRNLLTNRVIAYKYGNRKAWRKTWHRRHAYISPGVTQQREAQKVQMAQKISVLGRVSRFLRRVAKGA